MRPSGARSDMHGTCSTGWRAGHDRRRHGDRRGHRRDRVAGQPHLTRHVRRTCGTMPEALPPRAGIGRAAPDRPAEWGARNRGALRDNHHPGPHARRSARGARRRWRLDGRPQLTGRSTALATQPRRWPWPAAERRLRSGAPQRLPVRLPGSASRPTPERLGDHHCVPHTEGNLGASTFRPEVTPKSPQRSFAQRYRFEARAPARRRAKSVVRYRCPQPRSQGSCCANDLHTSWKGRQLGVDQEHKEGH